LSVFIASVAVALIVSFFCSLSEAAVLSLSPSQVAKMSHSHPNAAQIWRRFKQNIDRPISVILLLNTTAHTIGASVAGSRFDEIYGDEWIWAFSLILTFVMLQFTELAPKTLGVRHNYAIGLAIAKPMDILIRVFQPILHMLHVLNRPFRSGDEQRASQRAALEELSSMASFARLSNVISTDQEKIIQRVPKLSARMATQIMIPVEQVVFINSEYSINQAIGVAQLDPHTRFPVCENNDKDKVVGYVNLKELIFEKELNSNNQELKPIRPVTFVEPGVTAQELLKRFVNERIHLAIVKGNGKTLGLITMEDIIEEVLGELEDEFDRLPRMCHEVSGGTWMVGGGLSLKEMDQRMKLNMENVGPETISDWFISKLNKTPRAGDVVRAFDRTFQVRRMRRGKVFELSISGKKQ
jgi:putative hemolysin